MTQSKETIPGVKKEVDTDINDKNQIYFTDKILKIAYVINIDIYHDKHANSQLTVASKFDNTGKYINHINKIKVEMSHIYEKLLNQNTFKYQLTFLVIFIKYGEDDDEITCEIELPFTLSLTHNLSQSEIDNINIQCALKNKIQSLEMKESGWNFQRFNTMGKSFYKSGELNGSPYVKIL